MPHFRRFHREAAEEPYIVISLYHTGRGTRATLIKSDNIAEDGYPWPDAGCDAQAALSWAANYAGINATNLYVQLEDVDWQPRWGELLD